VTCLFVDIVGSTELVMAGPAERMKRLLDDAFARARSAIEAHDGTVENYLGDAVFALFGAPTAHADDPARALRAAFAIRDALDRQGIVVRSGIEAGDAVIEVAGAEHERQRIVVGSCVNVAARLQSAASPGEILIGPTCGEAVREVAHLESLGGIALKGIGTVPAWRVVSVQRDASPSPLPFVGRDRELAILHDAAVRARAGASTYVLIVGAPGSGKSRLASEFLERADGFRILVTRCHRSATASARHPLRQLLSDDDRDVSLHTLAATLEGLVDPEDAVRVASVLAHTAGIGMFDVLPANPVERQDEVLAAWRRYLLARAGGDPLLLWVDDIQWAEEIVVTLVERLTAAASDKLLVVATARPEFVGPPEGASLIRVEMGALDGSASRTLAVAAGGHHGVRALERAGGNPLFILELARARSATEDLPVTLHGAIAARFDELPREDRDVLRRAAIVGEAFGADDAVLLSGQERSLVAAALTRAQSGAYIEGVGAAFRFHHALVHEVAYRAVPVDERMRLHARFAQKGVPAEEVEVLSHHWHEALRAPDAEWVWNGAPDLPQMRAAARAAHIAAGDRLARRYAHERAADAYALALALCDGPVARADVERAIGAAYARNARGDDAWRHRMAALHLYREAGMRPPAQLYAESLSVPIFNYGYMTQRPAADEIAALLSEGEDAARAEDDTFSLAQLLLQRAFVSADPVPADEAERTIARASDRHASADVIQRLGLVRYSSGDLVGAARAYADVGQLSRSGARVDELEYLCFNAITRLLLGDVDGAGELAAEAMHVTRATGPHLRTHAQHAMLSILTFRGEWSAVEHLARGTLEVVRSNEATPWCWRAAGAIGSGALAAALAGRRTDAAEFLAASEPLTAPGPMRRATLLLAFAVLGRDADAPLKKVTIFDPAGLAEPIAAAMRGSVGDMHLDALDARAASGVRVAGAVAAALRERVVRQYDHRDLLALGGRGLSDLIRYRAP
jgi:class 3 adenylate cyclase